MTAIVFLGMMGAPEIVLILVIVLIIFGGRKIPELMKGLGKGIKEFKSATDTDDEVKIDKDPKE